MNKDQCGQGTVCVPNSKGCESDAVNNNCKNSDSDIRPDGENCNITLTGKQLLAEQFGIKIQWVCFDPFSKNGKELDVYNEDGLEVLNGVKCETLDRCTNFDTTDDTAEFVTYTCNDGTWGTKQKVDDDKNPVDQESGILS